MATLPIGRIIAALVMVVSLMGLTITPSRAQLGAEPPRPKVAPSTDTGPTLEVTLEWMKKTINSSQPVKTIDFNSKFGAGYDGDHYTVAFMEYNLCNIKLTFAEYISKNKLGRAIIDSIYASKSQFYGNQYIGSTNYYLFDAADVNDDLKIVHNDAVRESSYSYPASVTLTISTAGYRPNVKTGGTKSNGDDRNLLIYDNPEKTESTIYLNGLPTEDDIAIRFTQALKHVVKLCLEKRGSEPKPIPPARREPF